MSIRLMSAVFESTTLGPTERLILLALADHADEDGRCYPSISRLCARTGLKERAVRKNVRALEAAGYLTVQMNAGRSGSNLYFVRSTPARDAPGIKCPPAPDAPPPGTRCPSTPARDAPKPSGTTIEPLDAYASLSSGDDDGPPTDEIQIAVDQFNRAAEKSGWPKVRILSKSRRSALAARLRECGGLAGWAVALAKAQASPHCCGQNDRDWVANFDFITRKSSFTKLMEGNYDNRNRNRHNRPQQRGPGGYGSATVDAFAEVARRRAQGNA